MSVTITIIADSGPAAAREMANMISEVGKSYVEFSGAKTTPAPKTATSPAETKAEPQKEVGPKSEVAEGAKEKEAPAKEEKAPKAKKAKPGEDKGGDVEETLDGCRIMAKRVAASDGKEGTAGGITKANKIIESFGVAKLSDIPADKFVAFIEKCQEALDEAKGDKKEPEAESSRFD